MEAPSGKLETAASTAPADTCSSRAETGPETPVEVGSALVDLLSSGHRLRASPTALESWKVPSGLYKGESKESPRRWILAALSRRGFARESSTPPTGKDQPAHAGTSGMGCKVMAHLLPLPIKPHASVAEGEPKFEFEVLIEDQTAARGRRRP